ncbi:MAG: RNA-binding S4 domain-containing protein [Thermaurantimonas sp.]|uniref:RNA-binding S4 domain-containing protein n=1 Tax=Thermaurantimonas sp. TaxID=2681568 RepID=UPI0039195CEF
MRIDKFLWCVRLFKTRTLATEACNAGKITIDGQPVKPSREVKPGITFTYRNMGINYVYEIKDLPKSRVGAPLVKTYLENKTSQEELEKLEMIRLARAFTRPKGMGRPTKKERRDIESFLDDD